MNLSFYIALTAYVALFLVFGALLFWVHIPDRPQFESYRKSRSVFGYAYLLLGISAICEMLAPSAGTRNYVTIYIMAAVSLLHAWLNAYAYLLMLDPSKENRHQFLRYGILVLPIIAIAGFTVIFIPLLWLPMSILLGVLYVIQIAWMLWICRKEYRKCLHALDDYYDGTMSFAWMQGAIYLSVVLAGINLVNYYISSVEWPLRIANALFYFYFAIRLLNYLPMFFYIEAARREGHGEKRLLPGTSGESSTGPINNYTEKIRPLISEWVEKNLYCRQSLTLTVVADEIGTNRNYLSAYLNKDLGVSFQTWLNSLRVERAKVLLLEYPGKTVEEIGRMVGIPKTYNFSRWFRQITTLSPQQWRKKKRVG